MPTPSERPIEIEPIDLGVDFYEEPGHGLIIPRQDGAVANCGGPRVCEPCAREQRSLDRRMTLAAHAARVEVRLANMGENGDYFADQFTKAVSGTGVFRDGLPLNEALAHLSLLGAAVTGDGDGDPTAAAEASLKAVREHLA